MMYHFYRQVNSNLELGFYVETIGLLTPEEQIKLQWLISETFEPNKTSAVPFLKSALEIGPRLSIETPFSSNAVSIVSSMNINRITRIERTHRFALNCTRTAESYKQLAQDCKADFVALSGWLKLVRGLDPRTTFNIHPGPLSRIPILNFGGPGMHGHKVHEAVLEAYRKGITAFSAVSMHFVTEEYDRGPVFFEYPVRIEENDTADTLAARVNAAEHEWQPRITDMVVRGLIRWDGKDPNSLVVPEGYTYRSQK